MRYLTVRWMVLNNVVGRQMADRTILKRMTIGHPDRPTRHNRRGWKSACEARRTETRERMLLELHNIARTPTGLYFNPTSHALGKTISKSKGSSSYHEGGNRWSKGLLQEAAQALGSFACWSVRPRSDDVGESTYFCQAQE
jgi:hypothetical protein